MFGNLKNKLGEVTDLKKFSTPNVLSSLTGSRQQSVSQSPGSDTPVRLKHSRQSSNASQNGMLGLPSSTSSQNIREKELLNEISKLKALVERQQNNYQSSLTMKEQEWLARVQEEERKASTIERQLINIRENEKLLYQQLREKENIGAAVSISSNHFEETEKQLEILQEDYDQLEGLGTQEIAKVKHLLLDTSSQLEAANQQLDIKTANLEKLRQELETVKETARKYSTIVEEKMELDTTVAGLLQKLNITRLKIVTNEKESEDTIEHLQQKISILENRNKQDSLEDDDRIKAFIQEDMQVSDFKYSSEREALDHLLEEKRQELSNIKLSWSEKICNLESKIEHLSEKIAEDQVDLKSFEQANESLTNEVQQLKAENECDKEIYKSLIENEKSTLSRLQEDLETMTWHNGENVKALEKEIKELRRSVHVKEEEFTQLKDASDEKDSKLTELEQLHNEAVNDLEDTKLTLTSLQEEYKILKSSQEAFASSHSAEKENRQKLELELSTITNKCATVLSEKQKLSSNLDDLMDQVASLESDLTSGSEETNLLKLRCSEVELSMEDYRSRFEQSNNVMKDAEENFHRRIIQSDLVKTMEHKYKCLEDELADTKQKYKVQKQRMEDMKKTVQKELRIFPDTADSKTETNNFSSRDGIPSGNDSGRDLACRTAIFPNFSTFSGNDIEPINISYLKHVLLKFMTSQESEAVKLIRAIGELLHMTNDEERLLSETMQWKMSWFGAKPNLGKGQHAKAIPPSQ